MLAGISFSSLKVYDGVICDGHHRYLASLLAGCAISHIDYCKTSATIIIDWQQVEYTEEDYEPPEEIARLNEHDATFNELTIAELQNLLSRV